MKKERIIEFDGCIVKIPDKIYDKFEDELNSMITMFKLLGWKMGINQDEHEAAYFNPNEEIQTLWLAFWKGSQLFNLYLGMQKNVLYNMKYTCYTNKAIKNKNHSNKNIKLFMKNMKDCLVKYM